MIRQLKGIYPKVGDDTFVAETATLIGDVEIGKNSCIWYGAVIRGDVERIRIGEHTNIQDNVVVHGTKGKPALIGNLVSIGHGAIIHACTVEDNCLIGMNSVIMDGAVIGKNTIIGAMSFIGRGKIIPEGVLVMGSPAKVIRKLSEEEIQSISGYGNRNYDNALKNYLRGDL